MLARLRLPLLAAFLVCLVAPIAQPAEAAVVRSGTRYTLGADETVPDDLYVSALQAAILGHVQGDLFVLGGDVTISGPVDGSVNVVGGRVLFAGPGCGRSARIATSQATVDAAVPGDLIALCGELTTTPGARIGHEGVVHASEATLEGTYGQSLKATGTNLTLAGTVNGKVWLIAPKVAIGPTAVVTGPVELETASLDPIDPGARLTGALTRSPWVSRATWRNMLGWLLGFLAAYSIGLLGDYLAPMAAERLGELAVRFPGWRFLLGLGVLIGTPFVAIVCMLTLIGLPVGIFLLGGYLAALYLAQVVVGWAIGRYLLRRAPLRLGRATPPIALFVGLFAVFALRALPVVGDYCWFAIVLWGLGAQAAMAYNAFLRRHPNAAPPTPTA